LIVRRALAMGAITRGVPSGVSALRQVLGQVDVLVLAASPRANTRLLRAVADEVPSHVVVTDVGSVKDPIMAEALRLGLRRFVGGHPIAGNEGQGLASSSPDLFRGRAWALTPESAAPAAVTVVRSLVRAVGARPIVIRARAHDRALAFLSHVPQIVAWAIDAAAQGDRITKAHLDLAGPGFRDMTRLARSPRALWREILEENEAEVRRALAALLSRGMRSRPVRKSTLGRSSVRR
jgi:prephenate dehydrogenase